MPLAARYLHRLGALAVAGSILFAATGARAQTVRGTVVEHSTGAPLPGAIVVLLDSTGAPLVSALSDERGAFVLRAPSGGTFRLRVDVVGFVSEVTAPLRLTEGETVDQTIRYAKVARELPPVTVRERSRCVAAYGSGGDVAVLWEEVRKALAVTQLTAESRRYRFDLTEYERELDPETGAVRRSRSWRRQGIAGQPYESIAAESLAAYGYVRSTPDGTWYYAPDARTLLSDAFVRKHCLRRIAPGAGQEGLAGLGFEPIGRSAGSDVRGVLWLELSTSRLQQLEYTYTGLPRSFEGHGLGGRVAFERLSSGAWIVRDWRIRMPRVSRQTRSMPSSVPEAGPARMVPVTRDVVIGVIERGGEIAPEPGSAAAMRFASLVGTVYDSTLGAPLVAADIWLDAPGTAAPARHVLTDSTGGFGADSLTPGSYVVTVTHPRLDTLGSSIAPASVTLRGGERTALSVSTPPRRATVAALCADPAARSEGVIRGMVTRAAGVAAVPNASVRATWADAAATDTASPVSPTTVRTAAADASGRFTICGIPARRTIVLRASDPRSRGVSYEASLDSGELKVVTLLAPEHRAEIGGRVIDSKGRPVRGAAVRIDALDVEVRSDSSGAFRLERLPGGVHSVGARAIGFAPTSRQVRIGADARATVDIRLPVVVAVLKPVESTAARDPYRTGFAARRTRAAGGYFLDREQIKATGLTKMTELLRRVPGLEVRKYGNTEVMEFTGRGGRTFSSHGCPVAYVINGLKHDLAYFGLDGEIAVENVEAIEVYDAATAPAEYAPPGAGCGVVVIWTRERAVDPS